MPIETTSLTLALVLMQTAGIAMLPVIANSDPQTTDIYAVIGAMLASVVVLVDYGGTPGSRKGVFPFLAVFISAAVIGSAFPGAVLYYWCPDLAIKLTWHGWAAAGFLFGLAGWVGTRSVLWVFNRRLPGAIDDFVKQKLPRKTRTEDDNEP